MIIPFLNCDYFEEFKYQTCFSNNYSWIVSPIIPGVFICSFDVLSEKLQCHKYDRKVEK